MLFRIIFVLLHKTTPNSITYDYSHPVQRIHLAGQHHPSSRKNLAQRHQQEAQDFSDFEYHLRPTADFKGQIMSRGAWLKVLQPEWLAHEIRQWHEDAIKRYQEK